MIAFCFGVLFSCFVSFFLQVNEATPYNARVCRLPKNQRYVRYYSAHHTLVLAFESVRVFCFSFNLGLDLNVDSLCILTKERYFFFLEIFLFLKKNLHKDSSFILVLRCS